MGYDGLDGLGYDGLGWCGLNNDSAWVSVLNRGTARELERRCLHIYVYSIGLGPWAVGRE